MAEKLTEHVVAALAAPTDRAQLEVWDTELTGFGVVVGKTGRKTFTVRVKAGGSFKRRAIGVYGEPREDGHRWSVKLARIAAGLELGKLRAGQDTPTRREASLATGPTLRQGVALHASNMRKRGRSERSIKVLEDETDRHLESWLDRPIVEMRGADLAAIHDQLTRDVGAYAANRIVAHVSAVWNSLDRVHELAGRNPARAVVRNPYTPRRERIDDAALPDWYAKVQQLSPVRRDLRLFVLFTGMRDEAARTVRWEHVDWDRGALLVPRPKGGEARAFELPLTPRMLDMLRARQAGNRDLFTGKGGDQGWVFPSWSRDGKRVQPVQESKERRENEDGEREQILPGMHVSRRTYLSVAAEAGISDLDRHVLANHSYGRQSVNATYIRQAFDHLAECQARVEAALWARIRPEPATGGKRRRAHLRAV